MATVKLATLNLFNRMGEWGHRAPLVIDQLERLLPDVIGLQEVDMVLDHRPCATLRDLRFAAKCGSRSR